MKAYESLRKTILRVLWRGSGDGASARRGRVLTVMALAGHGVRMPVGAVVSEADDCRTAPHHAGLAGVMMPVFDI